MRSQILGEATEAKADRILVPNRGLSELVPIMVRFNKLLANYKNSAKVRNVPFTLSDEQFRELTQEKCFYCGSEPSQEKYRKFSNGAYVFNGIDRKDNSKGYVQGNVLHCCFICNRAKGNMSYEDFSL